MKICENPRQFPQAVSYTHLDVYKRQILDDTNVAVVEKNVDLIFIVSVAIKSLDNLYKNNAILFSGLWKF